MELFPIHIDKQTKKMQDLQEHIYFLCKTKGKCICLVCKKKHEKDKPETNVNGYLWRANENEIKRVGVLTSLSVLLKICSDFWTT